VAVSVADMVYLLPIVGGTILFSKLTNIADNREKWQCTQRIASKVAVFMTGVTAFVAMFATPIVAVIFGNAFLPAVPALTGLMPGIWALSLVTLYSSYLGSQNVPWSVPIVNCVAFLMNLVLNMLLIPPLGILGASFASTISYVVLFGCTFLIAKRNAVMPMNPSCAVAGGDEYA
jgi:O-antigen/teichoic acid export membrane protein